MGKPLSRPGCFRKSSCCLEKPGDGGVGGRAGGLEGGYGDGYVPQRSIYDTMCINQQIDSHHHHPGGSIRRDLGGEGSFSYSASGSLRVSRSPADMFDPQPRSLTPNPSFVRRLDERAIYDSLKLGAQDVDGGSCHSPGCFNRSVSPSVSSFSAPGVSSSTKKHHHHQHPHHHGDSRDGRHSWKVLTPPKHLECLELTTNEMMDRGGGYLNPGQYPPPGGQSSSLASPLISPFSGSPLSSGYHTPVFFSPAKPRPSQSQSLRCSPPHITQPRHYSQTQSLRLSPPPEIRRSPYRAPLVQLSAHDLEQEMRERGGGWGRNEREREWEREREREMERGWAQREWERERERGRLERERARERERRETSTFGTFGYGRPVPLRSDRDSVFLESDQVLDTTPLLLPQPSPSPNAAPRMGTGAVGRNRPGSKVGPESVGGGMVSKFDNGSVGLVLVDSRSGCGARLISEVGIGNMSETEIRAGIQEHHRVESWNKYDNGSRASIKNGSETRMGSQVKTRPGGRDLEGKVQSGIGIENMAPAVNKEGHRGGTRSGEKNVRGVAKAEPFAETIPSTVTDNENRIEPADTVEIGDEPGPGMKPEIEAGVEAKASSKQEENRTGTDTGGEATINNEVGSGAESRVEAQVDTEVKLAPTADPEEVFEALVSKETETKSNTETGFVNETQNSNKTTDKAQMSTVAGEKTDTVPADQVEKKLLDVTIESSHVERGSRSHKSKSSKSSSRSRPGTATGLRPGVVSPRLSRGFADLESTGPPEGIESTWPRRIMVRKRTVRQGGALHNLPILPPLPSVLSALEKRRPHAHLLPRPGHFSENPLSTIMNASSMVGRCSLKEPSHPELGPGASGVGRASLKEQNLEHWRVCREQEESMISRSKEKQREQSKKKTEVEERTGKEEKQDKARREEKAKREEKVDKEKVGVTVSEGLEEETKREKSERRVEVKVQEYGNKKEDVKKARDVEIIGVKVEVRGMKTKDGIQERQVQELEKAKSKKEESQVEEEEGGTFGEEGIEGWDTVLDMVNTLWEDGWEKGGEVGVGDTDSFSGSLQRWPLLRPPIGFGGSHPPSSAASELSLTELERRARELDSDLEHLDLSKPHRHTQDVYQTLLEPQRADMYQTHPGPQREKAAVSTGVVSRSQVSLELSAMASPAIDTDRPPVDWSTTSAGTSTVGTSSTKEDSSPDSNLTLESDSSGVFLSLSNQSQEEAGSDSDQPISGSDLGSSSTSLEKDGDEGGGLKEWGREESAELQWCYPSLLNTSAHEDDPT
ncbi:zinc finger CCCH domain-containing protein 13-like [Cyclopterus lumpus]|uniref:zinc finger CCCH domain-containing protein 13-like n=1 Tax=Cyclopterus lumpus TaxID=8103 RepID=UPI0014868147|nr:zinc finger CCCH domain-containing protein 13-like [Cyclopterus lumpus]